VAIALVKFQRKNIIGREVKPLILIGMTVARLDGLRFATVRTALLSLSVWVEQGHRSDAWLKGVIYRDMMGFSLRRCYHEAYKANRRDPRITNRGVTTRPTPHQSGIEGINGPHELPELGDD
jgi:hypothetical protein